MAQSKSRGGTRWFNKGGHRRSDSAEGGWAVPEPYQHHCRSRNKQSRSGAAQRKSQEPESTLYLCRNSTLQRLIKAAQQPELQHERAQEPKAHSTCYPKSLLPEAQQESTAAGAVTSSRSRTAQSPRSPRALFPCAVTARYKGSAWHGTGDHCTLCDSRHEAPPATGRHAPNICQTPRG